MVAESEIVTGIAERLAISGVSTDGRTLLKALGRHGSDDVTELLGRAQRRQKSKKRDSAKRYALLAFAAAPDRKDVREGITPILSPQSDSKDDVSRLLQSVLDQPKDPDQLRDLGAALRKQGHANAAAAAVRQALRTDRGDPKGWRLLSSILRDEGHAEQALTLARRAALLAPDEAWPQIHLGNLLVRMSQTEEAIDAYRAALQRDPQARGIRTALGRQNLKVDRIEPAARLLIQAVHENSKDRPAIIAMADVCERSGKHADAVVWRRRALELRPDSHSAERALAEALLRREHWAEARRYQRASRPSRDGIVAPEWDGSILPDETVGFYCRLGDPAEHLVLGLGVVRQLGLSGQPVFCRLPEDLAKLVDTPWKNVVIQTEDGTEVPGKRFGEDIAAYAPLAEAGQFLESLKLPLSPWVETPERTVDGAVQRVGFISTKEPPADWPNMDGIRQFVCDHFHVRAVYTEARPSIAKSMAALQKIDLVITDDQLTAVTAAATGCPSIVLIPASAGWPWGDRPTASLWAENQTLIRLSPDFEARPLLQDLTAAIESGGVPLPDQAPVRPSAGPQDLNEALDRISPYLAPLSSSTVGVEKLPGGTRNTVYRIDCEAGPRVLRMGRFPPPRQGFYAKEERNMRVAADAGLAPRVDFTDALDGSILMELVDGDAMTNESIGVEKNALAVATVFRRLHRLAGFQGGFDIIDKIDRNRGRLDRARARRYQAQETFNELTARIIGILRANGVPHYATHNDPLTRNFIRSSEAMLLIDWECSGLGDPHWEVAALSAQAGLAADTRKSYLAAYFGDADHAAMCRIPLYEALCRYYWWTDALITGHRSPDDPSWRGKAERWWNGFTDIVTAKSFEESVSQAEAYRWTPADSPAAAPFA